MCDNTRNEGQMVGLDRRTLLSYEDTEKLCLTEDEREFILRAADALESSFPALRAIDTGGAVPLVSVLDLKNVMRDDVSKQLITRGELLSNAPEVRGGYFQVPRTLSE